MKKVIAGLFIIASGIFNAASAQEAELLKASSFVQSKYGVTEQFLSFDIKIENLAYDKKVSVHYRDNDGQWVDQPAVYVGQIDGSQELWQAGKTIAISSPYATNDALDMEFVVKYEVNGQTYWDNNNGQNYQLASDSGEMITPEVYKSNAFASAPYEYNYRGQINQVTGKFSVNVLLQNLGYNKTVKIHYSYDNWATKNIKEAKFIPGRYVGYAWTSYPNSHGVEFWTMSTDGEEAQDKTAKEVKFAIEYIVEGETYWDNNFGQNYTVTIN